MPTLRIQGERVSSTWLRDALAAGDLATATELLGRPYRICGRIAHGDKRGRTIGFPTANIHLHRRSTALTGVYAVEVYGLEAEPLPGVGNIGNRPTVGGKRTLLEVHLLNFDQDIYARHVCVDFMRKLRDERRFASFEALREQIACDAMAAQAFFDKTV
jgi:riboflavin kinase/FMN adenylyltransferase